MRRRYFFFDIDGTLTDPATGRIVPSAAKTLQQLQEAGHFVAAATGRAHYKAKAFADGAGITNMVCAGGGGLVVDGELVENIPLPLDQAKAFLDEAEKEGRGWLLMLDDSDCVWMKDYAFLEQAGLRKEPTTYIYEPSLDYRKLDKICKIYMHVHTGEEVPWLSMLGHLRLAPEYIVCQYDAKKDGIMRMLERVGGKAEDVVVFGDDMNDLVMFDPVWTSIAMGNSCEELKMKADYVTAASWEDGIRKACQYYEWIPED